MISFTEIVPSDPALGGKIYTRLDGEIVKQTRGWLNAGEATVREVANLIEFGAFLATRVAGKSILTYGTPLVETPIAIRTYNARNGTSIRRSEATFGWNDTPSIFAIDYDPADGEALSTDELVARVTLSAPLLAHYQMLWYCSSSSYIYDGEEQIKGLGGQRLYFAVLDGTDIPRASKVMQKRAWINGHGYIFLKSNGAMTVRSTTDECMGVCTSQACAWCHRSTGLPLQMS